MLDPVTLQRPSPVPLRRQIARQLEEQILAGRLESGRRLPSVRALAGRLDVHRNTVAAAYRELHGWRLVRAVHGSGVYVSPAKDRARSLPEPVQRSLARLVESARVETEPLATTLTRLGAWGEAIAHHRLVVVEQDQALRGVLRHELAERLPGVSVCALPAPGAFHSPRGLRALPLVPMHPTLVRPAEYRGRGLPIRLSIGPELSKRVGRLRLPCVVGVVSGCDFVRGLVRESLEARFGDLAGLVEAAPRDSVAHRRIERIAQLVAVDAATARLAPFARRQSDVRVHVVARTSLEELAALVPPAGPRRPPDPERRTLQGVEEP